MDRRSFLFGLGAASLTVLSATSRAAPQMDSSRMPASGGAPDMPRGSPHYERLLVLVELKGGNDGLNMVVPYADPRYAALRPRLGLKREQVLPLSESAGLHNALEPLLPLWRDRQLAVVQGVGYPDPDLSHFRSIDIWETASGAHETRSDGWLARAFAKAPVPAAFAADGVVLGAADMGPFEGPGSRAIALANADQFLRQARLAQPGGEAARANPALAHLLKVEQDVSTAANHLAGSVNAVRLATAFPGGPFGQAVKTACQLVASNAGVACLRITLNGFDTHQNQAGTQAGLLRQLGEGLAALRAGLAESGRWNDTLVMTYAEFGRRPKENQSGGTDHGTAAPHFVLGGRVAGGLYGAAPALERLDGNGNLPFAVDFRQLYATALDTWWGIPSRDILGGRFAPLPLLA